MGLLTDLLAYREQKHAAIMAFLLAQRSEQERANKSAALQSDGMPMMTAEDYVRMIDGNGDAVVGDGAPAFRYPQRVLKNALPQFSAGQQQAPVQAPATDTSMLQRIRDRMAATRDRMGGAFGMQRRSMAQRMNQMYNDSRFMETLQKYPELAKGIPGSPNVQFEQYQPVQGLYSGTRPRYL